MGLLGCLLSVRDYDIDRVAMANMKTLSHDHLRIDHVQNGDITDTPETTPQIPAETEGATVLAARNLGAIVLILLKVCDRRRP